jgi:hypothetical protein
MLIETALFSDFLNLEAKARVILRLDDTFFDISKKVVAASLYRKVVE